MHERLNPTLFHKWVKNDTCQNQCVSMPLCHFGIIICIIFCSFGPHMNDFMFKTFFFIYFSLFCKHFENKKRKLDDSNRTMSTSILCVCETDRERERVHAHTGNFPHSSSLFSSFLSFFCPQCTHKLRLFFFYLALSVSFLWLICGLCHLMPSHCFKNGVCNLPINFSCRATSSVLWAH